MKEEPQIFTRIDREDVPVDNDVLDALRHEGMSESIIRSYIRETLNESIEFRELDSPLVYNRASGVKRLALCDTSVTDLPKKNDTYFAEIERWRYATKRGRRLKKPVLDELIPGVSDACIIGFLDFHSYGENGWYIDYIKTRGEFGGQKVASRLVDEFFQRYGKPGGMIHFGKMMHPSIGYLKDKMAKQHPDMSVIGAVNF